MRPEESLTLYSLCRGAEWHVLPEAGGWLDQPDWFVHDMGIISRRMEYLRRNKDRGKRAIEMLRKGKAG